MALNEWQRNFEIYRMRSNGESFKKIAEKLDYDYTTTRNVWDRMDQMVIDFGVKLEDAEEMARVFDKFLESKEVIRLVSALVNKNHVKNIHDIEGWNLDTKKLTGVGPKYLQALKNAQTYLKHGVEYRRDVHITISDYAYKLLKDQAAQDKTTMSGVVQNALIFYCDCDQCAFGDIAS